MNVVFEKYAHYYNLLYGNKNYAAEAKTVHKLLGAAGYKKPAKESNLLNIGCGTGRHDAEFAKMGYATHGIDLSGDMIDIAKRTYQNEANMSFEVADARSWSGNGRQYDVVTSLFHVASYQNTNEDVLLYFKTCAGALVSGGMFVFDAWYGPGVLTDRPGKRIKEVEDDKCRVIRFADPQMHSNRNIVDVNYTILAVSKEDRRTEEIRETHHMRYFFRPEMEYYLNQCGLELQSCVDCNTLEEPEFDSWTAYFVARRKK